MAAAKINVLPLYSDLSRSCENCEYDKALKIANKILHDVKDDPKVSFCKAVCLIHLSLFEEALLVLNKQGNDFLFEKAYCLYRLNRIEDAFALLKSVQNPSQKVRELIAQVFYRLERYEESFDAYKDLIKNSDDDYEEERETNLAAVVANLLFEKGKDFKKVLQLREHTYELCYNAACAQIAQGEYEKAIEKLKVAEDLCIKTLEENDVTEEEIESELGIIKVQQGYALQLLQKLDSAVKLYNKVLKTKPSDAAIVAVASNNIITINKDQNVFDSKKKIKVVTAENLESKLTSYQRQAIAVNHCLLLLQTNQLEHCKKEVQLLTKQYPRSAAEASLLHAAIFCKEKKVQKAVNILKDYAANHPDQSFDLSFTLSQLLLSQGHVSQACETLQSMGDLSYTPGVLSALVTLYLSLEDKNTAISLLNDAIAWYKKTNASSPSLTVIIQETAKMELKNGYPEKAASLLEELRRTNPSDLKYLAQLISAYSQFNPQKAKEVSKELPPVNETSLNVENLETTNWTMGAKYVRKGAIKPEMLGENTIEYNDDILLKKRRKKKKGKLPKNCDQNVDPDPERWLPKRERSTYKKKKDKRAGASIGKGTQGAISGVEELLKAPAASVPEAKTPLPISQAGMPGPRQQKAAQKKKKKGRW